MTLHKPIVEQTDEIGRLLRQKEEKDKRDREELERQRAVEESIPQADLETMAVEVGFSSGGVAIWNGHVWIGPDDKPVALP